MSAFLRLTEPDVVTIRSLFGEQQVPARRMGEWAVHRQVDDPRLWGITYVPQGMSLPFAWASFQTAEAAASAVADIVRLRNSWAEIRQRDLTASLEGAMRRICARRGAVRGPLQIAGLVDGPQIPFARPVRVKFGR